jgi:ParB-like chromosome segregation protein Spo0J
MTRCASGLVPTVERALADLRPCRLNDKLYRPVSPDDPEVQDLAESIRRHGLREPLVVTRDNVIISGHRRRVACQLAGLNRVPCRVEEIDSTDPRVPLLLTEYNRQRVKTLDEIAREEILRADPEDAYRELVEQRRQASRVEVGLERIQIDGYKRRSQISPAKRLMLEAVLRVIQERGDFLPLTLRQIHYALLNDPPLRNAQRPSSRYANDRPSYKDLSDLLLRARLDDTIPWDVIEDNTRPVATWACHRGLGPFIREQLTPHAERGRRCAPGRGGYVGAPPVTAGRSARTPRPPR